MLRAFFGGELFGKGHQLVPVALALVVFGDVEAGEFGLLFLRIKMQRDAADQVAVDLQHPVIIEVREDVGARAPHQFLVVHRLPDQRHAPRARPF